MKPTIVLVHGAFAESGSWYSVIDALEGAGHPVIAAANQLRDPAADGESVADVVRSIAGPVVLVAHSYGGAVISNVPADAGAITGLVFVNGFAPDAGESCFSLAARFPGSGLGTYTLRQVRRSEAVRLAATQRPAAQEALFAPSGTRPLWRVLPSWFAIGEDDRIIPAELQRFMAERALARRVLAIPGASHALAVSHAEATVDLILEAAAQPVTA
jgi:pimeloyl-ACP methyl ester carboxylesterase